MKKLLTLVSAMAFVSLSAMAGVDYTFADGQLPTGYSNGHGEAAVINGNLHVEMALQNDGYRSDIQFGSSAAITLDPSTDRYLAIKFNGTAPDGKMTLEFKKDSSWYNSKWKDNANRSSITDSNDNTIYYFDLAADDNYTAGTALSLNALNVKISKNSRLQNYSIDWIKTFATEADIEAYKDTRDDGAKDYAIWNETTNTGYDKFITAVETAASAGSAQVLTVRQNVCLNNARANIKIANADVTIQGSDPRITVTRKNWNNTNIFILAEASGVKMTIKDICFDGQGANIANKFIEGKAGSEALYDNVTFRNHNCANGSCAIQVKFKTTVKDCKFINLTNFANSGNGAIFVGANSNDQLILEGNNVFDNTNVNLYVENQYRFIVKGATHTTPISISLNSAKWNNLSSNNLLFLNKNENDKNSNLPANISNFVVLNDGICLTIGGSGHLYEGHLAEGYAANITELSYATFYGDDDMELAIPAGVEAYACKVNEAKEYATLIPIEDVIPAGTAVLLYSENAKLYQFVKSETAAIAVSDNDMKGSASAIELNGSAADYYLLTSEGGNPVFKHVNAANTVTSGSHKAYIELAKSANGAPALRIRKGGEASGISVVTVASEEDGAAYNVAGQQIDRNYRGIVIRNGKKQIQK